MTVPAAVRRLRTEYVKCRSWGHEWDDFIPIGRRRSWGITISLRCDRCTTERHDTIDQIGNLSKRQYVYPEGYKLSAIEKPTAEALRLEVVRRLRAESDVRVAKRAQRRRRRAA